MSRKILMICYYFPPLNDVGCKRSVAFSKYLKSHGWEPHVLSVKNPDKQYCSVGDEKAHYGVSATYVRSLFNLSWFFGKINGFLGRLFLPLGVKLRRNYLHDFFSIPDHFIGWTPGAILGGYQIIKKHHLDYIYVSCTPFSSALAGIILKKLTGKPLIIDFRDPLAVNVPDNLQIPRFRKRVNLMIEKKIIHFADLFIVNTKEVRYGYIKSYPDIANKTVSIYNGFDHELMPPGQFEKFEKFTIVYGGNMYFQVIKSESFFKAVAWLKEKGKINRDNFQFLYFGADKRSVNEISERFGIIDLVQAEHSISHAEMLKVLMRAHLQLLRIVKPMISTKLFEGIALNLPFLATIPQGEVADIIAEYSPSSFIVHEDSPQAIIEAIMAAMMAYHQGTIRDNLVSHFLEKFSRENMTYKLERAIENIFDGNKMNVSTNESIKKRFFLEGCKRVPRQHGAKKLKN